MAAGVAVGAGLDGADVLLAVAAAVKELALALDEVGHHGVFCREFGDDADAHHVIEGPERVRELQHGRPAGFQRLFRARDLFPEGLHGFGAAGDEQGCHFGVLEHAPQQEQDFAGDQFQGRADPFVELHVFLHGLAQACVQAVPVASHASSLRVAYDSRAR